MNLSEYLTQLSYKELSNLSLADSGSGSIKFDKIPFVVSCINEALLRLYSKFVLKEGSLIIELREWLSEYHLDGRHTLSSGCIPEEQYILDGEHPFQGDLIKVLEVYSEKGERVPLNNASNPMSVFTPRPDVLQVPNPYMYGDILAITYQARHPVLNYHVNPMQEIELPDNLFGALSAYVAYSVYSTLNTTEATGAAQKYMQMYAALVQETIETDMANSSISQDSSRFYANGWC